MKRLDCSTGYLIEVVTNAGIPLRYGVRRSFLDSFIASVLDRGCTLEILGFCKMPRNSGIKIFGSDE